MMESHLARGFLAALALLVWAFAATAQTETPDYDVWQSVAVRAENAVASGRASDDAFDRLRGEIVSWRQQFQSQLSANAGRIQNLRAQIDALGPVPEDGTEEAPEIAARRAELNDQLERMNSPRRTAEVAFNRANGIITEIDEIARQRQADELLRMGPWPLNPAHWGATWRDVQETLIATVSGTRQSLANPTRRATAQDNLPLILILLAISIVLLSRSRKWTELLAIRIQRATSRTSGGIAGFFVSLGQIILPMLGILALIRAVGATELFGRRGEVILNALEPMGLALFFTLWLGSRFFPRDEALRAPLHQMPKRRTEARLNSYALGLVFAISILVDRMAEFERYSPETVAVLNFPLTVVASLLLMRMGWLLRRAVRDRVAQDGAERGIGDRFVGSLAQATIAVAVVSPVLAALGYETAARTLVYPTMSTLALFGTIALVQALVRDIYEAVRPGEGARDSLIPTLISFALAVFALPVLALIWGARVTDLTELWARLRTGLTIGDTTISPSSFFTLIIVFVLGYMVTRGVQGALKSSVLPKTSIDPGGQTAIVSGLGYVGIFLAALVAITAAGIDLSSLAIVAGALSVGIGFGLQTIVSNFVSGIILLIERPISEGDWIEVGGQMGYVRRISVRSTRIETFDRTDVIVPNADLISGTVTNYTRGNTVGRVIIPVGVAYGTDTRRVEGILKEIADAHPMALANPAPMILFAGFGADSLDFEIRIILRDVNWSLSVRNEINHQIAARFIEEGIEIPFAQRDIWLRNPEALHGQSTKARPGPSGVAHIQPEDLGQTDNDADGDGR